MRDPDRIDRILQLLSQYWHAYPDMRLAQIVGNCFPAGESYQPYHMEDNRLEVFLRFAVTVLERIEHRTDGMPQQMEPGE